MGTRNDTQLEKWMRKVRARYIDGPKNIGIVKAMTLDANQQIGRLTYALAIVEVSGGILASADQIYQKHMQSDISGHVYVQHCRNDYLMFISGNSRTDWVHRKIYDSLLFYDLNPTHPDWFNIIGGKLCLIIEKRKVTHLLRNIVNCFGRWNSNLVAETAGADC